MHFSTKARRCVVLRQPCTVAVFVRNCPKNKVSFLGVAALWVDCMPFPADQEQWVISNRFMLETNSKRFAIRIKINDCIIIKKMFYWNSDQKINSCIFTPEF